MRARVVAVALSSLFLGCSSSNSGSPGAPTDAGPSADVNAAPPSDTVAESTRAACGYTVGSLASETQGASAPDGTKVPIDTIVIIMMENRSFDHYFQDLPNNPGWSVGDGSATASSTSVDVAPAGVSNAEMDGTPVPFAHAMQPSGGTGGGADGGAEGGADGGAGVAPSASGYCFADTNHDWDGTHREINGGKMSGFVVANDGTHDGPMIGPPDFLDGARAMTYYTKDDLPFMYWAAENFAIGDRYFAAVPGPTWPNREYLYAGTSWGETTTGAFPMPTSLTVLDSLSAKNITWGNYAGPLSSVLIFAHEKASQSLYAKYLYPNTQLATDAMAGKLPQVTFIDPNLYPEGYNNNDEHPPALMQVGENWLAGTLQTLMASPQWAHMAVFLLWDEHGGLYDHVAPPPACAPDATQPKVTGDGGTYGGFVEEGIRLPFAVFSPYSKHHYVSHKVYDHASVLRFVEARFALPALTKRDANALAPWDVFDFTAAPTTTPPAVPNVPIDQTILDQCQTIFTAQDVANSPYAM
jgi:phospholipase C